MVELTLNPKLNTVVRMDAVDHVDYQTYHSRMGCTGCIDLRESIDINKNMLFKLRKRVGLDRAVDLILARFRVEFIQHVEDVTR